MGTFIITWYLSTVELEHENMGDDIVVDATAILFRKGRKLLDSGFVEDIQDAVDGELYYLRAHVHRSMKKELPLSLTINISNKSGFVEKATCGASKLERCCHISTLLLMTSDYIAKAYGQRSMYFPSMYLE